MKIAVITGASSGLGIEFLRAAVTLCPEIDTYWLIARREDRLEALKPQFPEKKSASHRARPHRLRRIKTI